MATNLKPLGYKIEANGDYVLDGLEPGVEYILATKSAFQDGGGGAQIVCSQVHQDGVTRLKIDDGDLDQSTPKTEARFACITSTLFLSVNNYSIPIYVYCLPRRKPSR